jgi:hypothetical protein
MGAEVAPLGLARWVHTAFGSGSMYLLSACAACRELMPNPAFDPMLSGDLPWRRRQRRSSWTLDLASGRTRSRSS